MADEPQLEFIFRSDLRRILASTWAAHNGLAGAIPVREVQIYQAGFRAALEAVGLAVGVEWRPAQEDHTPHRRAVTVFDQRL